MSKWAWKEYNDDRLWSIFHIITTLPTGDSSRTEPAHWFAMMPASPRHPSSNVKIASATEWPWKDKNQEKRDTWKANSRHPEVPHDAIHLYTTVSLICEECKTKDKNQLLPMMKASAIFWEQRLFVHTTVPPLRDSAVPEVALQGRKTKREH